MILLNNCLLLMKVINKSILLWNYCLIVKDDHCRVDNILLI